MKIKITPTKIMTEIKLNTEKFCWAPNKVKIKCPAIIFAIKRIAKVKGRIIFLIISINTIKGWRIKGVPIGTRWANINKGWFFHLIIICPNHKGRAKLRVNVIWVEEVKI